MGARARARVLDHFLSPGQLSETMHVVSELASPPRRAARGCHSKHNATPCVTSGAAMRQMGADNARSMLGQADDPDRDEAFDASRARLTVSVTGGRRTPGHQRSTVLAKRTTPAFGAEATSGTALPTTPGPQVADEVATPAAAVPRGRGATPISPRPLPTALRQQNEELSTLRTAS